MQSLSKSPQASIGLDSLLDYTLPIPHFANLSSPLYTVTPQINLQMTPELRTPFHALKSSMCSAAALRITDPTVPFALEIDANITTVRSWIETASTYTPTELEGYPASICNYAAIRNNLLGHVIGTHVSLNK